MALTRRQFMTLTGGSAAAAVIFAACGVPEDELLVQSSIEMPEDLVSGRDNWYATLCAECAAGEGVVVRVMEGRAKKIEGNVDYPVNVGKHSARCEAGLQALYNPDRIRGPLVRAGERGANQFEEISWTDAISRLAYSLQNIRSESRQRRVLVSTNPMGGHLGYVVRSFVDAYGATYAPFEPLEKTNLKSAVKTVFGQDRMPDFDIANANVVLSFGADFLNTWGTPVRYSRAYGEFRQGKDRKRGTHYHVDSRFSMTAANADKWIPVKPGTEGLFALSVAQAIAADGMGESAAVDALTGGDRSALDAYAPSAVAGRIGVSADLIRKVAHDFAEHAPSVAFGGGSAAAHTNGEANLIAIYSLNHLVGGAGAAGGARFNPPPPLENIAPTPSVSPMSRWRTLVNDMRSGRIDALLMAGADPFYALPASLDIHAASYDVPLIVSFSDTLDDSAAMSDLILPRHTYLEDWGTDAPDFGPGYQMVGFQQPVVRPFFENRGAELGSRGLGDVLMSVAQGIGIDLGLGADTFRDVIRADAQRLYALGRGSVGAASFGGFWNGVLQRGGWWDSAAVQPPNGHVPPPLPAFEEPQFEGDGGFEFYLTPFSQTGIGEGQRAHLPWMQATPDPITTAAWRTWIEINIRVAENRDIREGDVIRVTSPRGSIEALAFPHPGVPPDTVSIPFGQGHAHQGRYAKDRGSNVFAILAPLLDSQSGAFAWAATKVNIEKTDDWVRVPKFENTVPESPIDEHHRVYEVTATDG